MTAVAATAVPGANGLPGAPRFAPADDELLEALARHGIRGLDAGEEADARTIVAALLRRIPHAAMLLGARGRMTEANEAALTLLTEGGSLLLRQGRLTATGCRAAARLASLLDSGKGGELLLGDSCEGLRLLTLAPLRPAVTLATVIEPHRRRAGLPATLCRLFGLSAAEARVASALAEGATPTEIGAVHRVSVATVRCQIAAVYAKLQVHRQAELVRLLTLLGEACVSGDHQYE
jgi:DNA-binding CsgD family transcriptional regulator